jgi:streptomycin 6-kinase
LIEIPEELVRRRIRTAGEQGEEWVRRLPSMVVELENVWGLRLDGEPMHGEVALVVPVVRDREPLILKVSYPDKESVHEAVALRVWNGNGSVRLIESDSQRNALLLERLDATRSLRQEDPDEAMSIAASLLKRLVAPPVAKVRDLMGVVDHLTMRFDQAGDIVPSHLLEAGKEWLEAYCPIEEQSLVNVDLHTGNVLAGEREPWLVIDPRPIVGEVAFGIAPLFWNLTPQELSSSLRRYFDQVVDITEVDGTRAVQWTVTRTLYYWVWAWNTGYPVEEVAKAKYIVETLTSRQ